MQEIESKYGDLVLHSEIRSLSRGKVLNRFVEYFDNIQILLYEIGENDLELYDKQWFLSLLFLTEWTITIISTYDSEEITIQF